MNNRFGDSRQRFSIRKFTVGVASVLLSSAVFGVSTAKADQAEEPKGQPATSVLEEASESDGGGQRLSLIHIYPLCKKMKGEAYETNRRSPRTAPNQSIAD